MRLFATSFFLAAIGGCLMSSTAGPVAAAPPLAAVPPVPNLPPAGRAYRKPQNSKTCLGNGARAFFGVPDGNVPAAIDAAILGGQSNTVCDDYSAIGGGRHDSISSGGKDTALASFIGGGVLNQVGSPEAFIGGGAQNSVDGTLGAIGGGVYNDINAGSEDFIGGGLGDSIITATQATIGGGYENTITVAQAALSTDGADYATIAGGEGNSITANVAGGGYTSFIGGGYENAITGGGSVIAGGNLNRVTAFFGTVGGGGSNSAGGEFATVAGGGSNAASGAGAAVPGGSSNTASGVDSFAAGSNAQALTNGSFVWSDDAPTTYHVTATQSNQFLARAIGGFAFYTNAHLTSGVSLAPGSGTWSSLSDRSMKTGIAALNDASILAKVAALPVSEWSYTSERGVRHIGPMAQDFYAAFRVGEDDRHITTIDEDGVALAAVKAVHAENRALRADVAAVRDDNAALHAQNATLARELHAVERTLASVAR
jgi:hypothetical protein